MFYETRHITDDLGFQHTIHDLDDRSELRFGTQVNGERWMYRWHHRVNGRIASSGEMKHLSINCAIGDFYITREFIGLDRGSQPIAALASDGES